MAFFDDIGKKLSQAGQTAVQKTKEVTDIARLNGAISDQEKKQTETYCEIGKLYVSKHPKDYDNDFSSMIATLRDSEIKIKEYRKQISDIKGVVKCEKCGAEIGNNVAFCSSCGAKAPQVSKAQVDEDHIKCPECGAIIDKDSKFCTACGKVLSETTKDTEAAPGNNQGSVNNNTCPICGATMTADMAFCTKCGNKKQ